MHRKRGQMSFGIWEKLVSRVLASEDDGWLSELTEALRQASHVVGGRWKSQHKKIAYLPPYVQEPFNSKVIKCFVPELRSRKIFFVCFGIPMLSIYELWKFYVYCTYSCMDMVHYKQYSADVSPCKTSATMSEKSVTWANYSIRAFIKHHDNDNSFFGKTIC